MSHGAISRYVPVVFLVMQRNVGCVMPKSEPESPCACSKDKHCSDAERFWDAVRNTYKQMVEDKEYRPVSVDFYIIAWDVYREHRKSIDR
jgi:hypothetical protein